MPIRIGRRELIASLGGAAAWPLPVRARQTNPMHFGGWYANYLNVRGWQPHHVLCSEGDAEQRRSSARRAYAR